jgi:hypothetical protein
VTYLLDFADNLGKVICNITEYRKVVLMTFPLDVNRILCVSASPRIDISSIRDEILKIIGSSKWLNYFLCNISFIESK